MLLTITTTAPAATDLGYLLHKHPDRVQSFDLAFGRAHVFYPEASEQRCTAALLLDIDPVGLVRNRRGPSGENFSLEQYVNDRPYVASSFMSVAIARIYGSALAGTCNNRPELVETPLELEINLAVLPIRGGEPLLRDLFEPLGYHVHAVRHPLDERFSEWGDGPYHTVTLKATKPLHQALSHLYVLIPVLDNDKHYWVGREELEKLFRHGEGWLGSHPHREMIATRYLRYWSKLTREAVARLSEEDQPDPEAEAQEHDREEQETVERPLRLNEQRHASVIAALKSCAARRVLDLGCANGVLLRRLLDEREFEQIVGLDVSLKSLEIAEERLKLDRLPDRQKQRITLLHGSLMYRDERLKDFDAAVLVEVIEHMDPPRLAALERSVFEFARPKAVIVTTPNAEYNVRFETMPAGTLRHKDHRFEWSRAEFERWAAGMAQRFAYRVRFMPVGTVDAEVGSPTQMAIFQRD